MAGNNSGAIEAGKAVVRLGVDDAGLRSGLDRARRFLLDAGKKLAIGGGLLSGLGGLGLAPVMEFFHEAVHDITEVRKASEQLGTTTEIFSGLGFAAQKAGVDTDGLVGASRRYLAVISEAASGNTVAAEALAQVSLDAKQLINLPLDQQFAALADGISKLGTEAEQVDLTRKILGRGGAALLPMLKQGAAGLAELKAKAGDLGQIVSSKDAADAKIYTGAIDQAKLAIQGLAEAIGASLLPRAQQIKQWSDILVNQIKDVREWVDANRQIVRTFVAIATAVVAAGATLVGVGSAFAVASFAIGGFITAAGTVASLAGTFVAWAPAIAIIAGVAAALGGLGYVLYEFTPLGGIVSKAFHEIAAEAMWAWGIITEAWSGIQAALSIGDLRGALDIAKSVLKIFWLEIQLGATKGWNAIKDVAVDAWLDIVGEAKKAWIDVDTQLKIFGTDMKGYLEGIFNKIWDFFINGWKNALKALMDMQAAEAENRIQAAKWTREHWKDVLGGAIGTSGLGSVFNGGKAAIDAAATSIGEGKALADEKGVQTAQELLRAKGEQLKAAEDILTEEKKRKGHEARAAAVAEIITKLKEEEAELQRKVDAEKKKAIGSQGNPVFGLAARILLDPTLGARRKNAMEGISEIRGGFGGSNVQARFGVGSAGDKQLKKLDDIDKKLGNIEKQGAGVFAD